MLFTLSPAKKLDVDTPLDAALPTPTQPQFVSEATTLIDVLREKSPEDIAALMKLSDNLAELNAARYADWQPRFTAKDSRPAVLAFNGDVYEGLDARTLPAKALMWAQDHLAILSGLYGVLRPLDLMRPYRLEMGTRLAVGKARTLYAFWGDTIARHLNAQLAHPGGEPIVINLASEEYFKAVSRKALQARVVQCVFEDWKNDEYKVISFHAKRARGLMARFAVLNQVDTPDGLRDFDLEGYRHAVRASEPDRLVFRRKTA